MTEVLLVRHGNTFAAGDKVIWVGARTDLPLTPEGEDQARRLARGLRDVNYTPDILLAGPLQRTRRHAALLAEAVGGDVQIEDRLREIDYGAWEALSSEEIRALGGGDQLEQWDKRSQWPSAPGWVPDEATLFARAGAVLDEALRAGPDGRVLIVSSNGVLRFFARHATNARDWPKLKVATGAACRMRHGPRGWVVESWNVAPEAFA